MATNDSLIENIGAGLLDKVRHVQKHGQVIVGMQNSLVNLDQQRAKLRESLHAMKRLKVDNERIKSSKTYTAVCTGLFVQYPNEFLKVSLKQDLDVLDKTIEDLRKEMHDAVDNLRRLEGDKDLTQMGFNLKPLNEDIGK